MAKARTTAVTAATACSPPVTRRSGKRAYRRTVPPHPHDLRHGCASLLLALGVPPRTIADLLGHTTLDMTLFRYAHVSGAMLDAAAQQIDGVFQPIAGAVAGGP